jgi:hypothetical protein
MSDSLEAEMERTTDELEHWLATQARAGAPELMLISLLREQADTIEQRGYISRTDSTPPQKR